MATRDRYGDAVEGEFEPPPRSGPRRQRCVSCGGRQWVELAPEEVDRKFPFPSPPPQPELGDSEQVAAARTLAYDAYLRDCRHIEALRAAVHVKPCPTCIPVVAQKLNSGCYSKDHKREDCERCRIRK